MSGPLKGREANVRAVEEKGGQCPTVEGRPMSGHSKVRPLKGREAGVRLLKGRKASVRVVEGKEGQCPGTPKSGPLKGSKASVRLLKGRKANVRPLQSPAVEGRPMSGHSKVRPLKEGQLHQPVEKKREGRTIKIYWSHSFLVSLNFLCSINPKITT